MLILGYRRIKSGDVHRHKLCMIAAFAISVAFLATYVIYRSLGAEKRFTGQGAIRPLYFFILATHVVLAATVPFLAGRTLYLALRGRFVQHRRIARITLPIWLYVSVTGVLVYVFLFVLY